MKSNELRDKTIDELRGLERKLRDELFMVRMKHYSGQLQKVSQMRELRRDIARVLTVRREKEVA